MSVPNCHICAVIPPGAVWKEKEGRLSSSSNRPHHLISDQVCNRKLVLLPQEQMQAKLPVQMRVRYTSQWHLPKLGRGIPLHWLGCSPPVQFIGARSDAIFRVYQGGHHDGK